MFHPRIDPSTSLIRLNAHDIVSFLSFISSLCNATKFSLVCIASACCVLLLLGFALYPEDRYKIEQGGGRIVCLPGARIEHVTERVEKIMGRGKGGTILVHIGTNNADKEGTTTIVDKYRKLLKKTKEARVEQIILSGILPVFGNRIDGYRNSKRMAINGMVKRLCKEEDVGYVDLWDSVVGKEGMYARDGLHLSGKGAAVFAEGLSGAVASGLGKVRYLN